MEVKSEPIEKFGIISLNTKNKIIGIDVAVSRSGVRSLI
jgi:hypothetical protein